MKPKIKEGINDKEIDGGRKMSEKTESRTTYTYKEWQAKIMRNFWFKNIIILFSMCILSTVLCVYYI